MWFVYVLKSDKNGRLYTGSTDNFERRLAESLGAYDQAAASTRCRRDATLSKKGISR